jgi:hypothetical protein
MKVKFSLLRPKSQKSRSSFPNLSSPQNQLQLLLLHQSLNQNRSIRPRLKFNMVP